MRIPVIYIRRSGVKRFFHIERRYVCKSAIVPVGCDCHPAYVLQALSLRKHSLPFDWLNINPVSSLEYISKNLKNRFIDFLENSVRNDKGHLISANHPDAEFIHENDLNNPETISKFQRRIQRLFNITDNKSVIYLHNIPISALNSNDDIKNYITGIKSFVDTITLNSTLHVYLRFDESFLENKEYANKLIMELNKMKVKNHTYLRQLSTFGIWGNKRDYVQLLKSLSIDIYMRFPGIFLK